MTDLTSAYNSLASAVTSAGITSTSIATINTDWSAVLTAAGSSSTATYPYFSLVAGRGEGQVFGLEYHGEGMWNTAYSTAVQTLQSDIQTIQLASGTTVGEQTALGIAFQTLHTDGLTPSSYSALQSFENSLVTTNANSTTPGILTGNATLLAQFEAIYTSSPTTQQTTDLTSAYNCPGVRGDLGRHHLHEYCDHQHRLVGRARGGR